MKLLALLLLIGCAHGYGIVPPPAHASDRNAKLVRSLTPYASRRAWERSPYWRLDDFEWPWYLIVATDNTACPLWANVVFLPNTQDYFICPTSWRMSRP